MSLPLLQEGLGHGRVSAKPIVCVTEAKGSRWLSEQLLNHRGVQGDGASGTSGATVVGLHLEGHLALSIRYLDKVYASHLAVSLGQIWVVMLFKGNKFCKEFVLRK